MQKFKELWARWFSGKERSKYRRVAIVVMLFLMVFGYHKIFREGEVPEAVKRAEQRIQTRAVGFGTEQLEDDIEAKMDRFASLVDEQRAAAEVERTELKDKIKALTQIVQSQSSREAAQALDRMMKDEEVKTDGGDEQTAVSDGGSGDQKYPTPPSIEKMDGGDGQNNVVNAVYMRDLQGQLAEPILTNGFIAFQGFPEDVDPVMAFQDSVLLAPGLMAARLLGGVRARTIGDDLDPKPLMFRIQTPAILPNEVKEDLSGCFAIGNSTGELDSERVEVRMVSLHCVSHDKRLVVNECIEGHVSDGDDGIRGMAARIRTKMGAATGRAFAAGVIGGFGTSLSEQTDSAVSINLSGVSGGDLSLTDAAKKGLGRGIARGSDQLVEMYVELMRSTGPIAEVGATKKVDIVIISPVRLRIRQSDADGETLSCA